MCVFLPTLGAPRHYSHYATTNHHLRPLSPFPLATARSSLPCVAFPGYASSLEMKAIEWKLDGKFVLLVVKTGKSSLEQISRVYRNQAVVVSIDPRRVYMKDPTDVEFK